MPPTVRRFDVCNSDADGLCAVRQWRLREPAQATLVTGLEREIALLQRVPAVGPTRCWCATSPWPATATRSCHCSSAAWRCAGSITMTPARCGCPASWRLSRLRCRDLQRLLVERHLGGAHRAWALVGAYGDALTTVTDRLAAASGFDALQRAALRRLGQAINYNAYGEQLFDLRIAPAELYGVMARHADPFALLATEPVIDEIDDQREADLRRHWLWRRCGRTSMPACSCCPMRSGASASRARWPTRCPTRTRSGAGCAAPEPGRRLCRQPARAAQPSARCGGGVRGLRWRWSDRGGSVDALPPADMDRFVAADAAAR